MKPEKDVKWCGKLYKSPHCRHALKFKFSCIPGCKKDFERIVGAGENSKEFNEWFNELKDEGVFVFVGKISRGVRNNVIANGYNVDLKCLIKYVKTNPEYKDIHDLCNVDTVI